MLFVVNALNSKNLWCNSRLLQ